MSYTILPVMSNPVTEYEIILQLSLKRSINQKFGFCQTDAFTLTRNCTIFQAQWSSTVIFAPNEVTILLQNSVVLLLLDSLSALKVKRKRSTEISSYGSTSVPHFYPPTSGNRTSNGTSPHCPAECGHHSPFFNPQIE